MNIWKRITEVKPEPDQEVLVYDRGNMFVSSADFYSEELIAQYREWGTNPPAYIKSNNMEALKKHYLECTGSFKDFGQKSYFDDPKVFWMELPEEPKNV